MKNKKFPIIIGKIQTSPLIQDQNLACLNYSALKSQMGAVLWKSWVWKSLTLASLIFSTFANSIVWDKNTRITLCDPHSWLIPRVLMLSWKYYEKEPRYTRNSSVLVHCHTLEKKIWYDPTNGSIRKSFVFNPLVPFSNWKGWYIQEELQVEWFMSSLQGIFAVNDFWPRNLLAVWTAVRLYLAFNKMILQGNSDTAFFTLKDLADFFLHLSNYWKLPDYVNDYIDKIDPLISAALRPSLRKMIQNVKTDKSYFDSANTKLWVFLLQSNESIFWVGLWKNQVSKLFDMAHLFLGQQKETELNLIDLSKFWDEKNLIASCLINAEYFFWKKRPVPAINENILIIDEYQSLFLLRSTTLHFMVQKILQELRKFSASILIVAQELDDSLKILISHMWFLLVFGIKYDTALKVIDDLNAWIQWNIELLPEHLSNLSQWSFFARLDTKNNGIITILAKGINFTIETELDKILSFSPPYSP